MHSCRRVGKAQAAQEKVHRRRRRYQSVSGPLVRNTETTFGGVEIALRSLSLTACKRNLTFITACAQSQVSAALRGLSVCTLPALRLHGRTKERPRSVHFQQHDSRAAEKHRKASTASTRVDRTGWTRASAFRLSIGRPKMDVGSPEPKHK